MSEEIHESMIGHLVKGEKKSKSGRRGNVHCKYSVGFLDFWTDAAVGAGGSMTL